MEKKSETDSLPWIELEHKGSPGWCRW